jgi:hypothetical protein
MPVFENDREGLEQEVQNPEEEGVPGVSSAVALAEGFHVPCVQEQRHPVK